MPVDDTSDCASLIAGESSSSDGKQLIGGSRSEGLFKDAATEGVTRVSLSDAAEDNEHLRKTPTAAPSPWLP
uniref:Uncharacterized protein n=1 Tax=Steinernema glaseri TaxID=37863 RepID=A0A1I7XWL9_9BILA